MSTDAVTSSMLRTLSDYKSSSSSSSGSSGLNMDDFLNLFVAQLTSQDPLSSSSDSSGTDYISQLAQLTMMEQLSSLNNSLATSQAYSMIGKYVYIGEGSDADMMFGKVDGVINDGGVNSLLVSGETYDLSEVYAVIDDDAASAATDDKVLQSADLIGKTVTATIVEEDKTEATITGKVEKILIEDEVIYFVINNRNIEIGSITEISTSETEEETQAEAV